MLKHNIPTFTCHKLGQEERRVIIKSNSEGLNDLMLHTKIQVHWPIGSIEEDF